MASLIFGAGVFAYDAAHKRILKRRATKAHNAARFSELERDNAARIARLRELCACGGDHFPEEHPGGGGRPMGADAGLGGQDSIPYSDSHHRRGRTMSMPDVAMVGVGGGGGGGGGEESQDDANARAPRAASMEDAPPPVYEEVVVVMDERGKGRKKRGFWKGWR